MIVAAENAPQSGALQPSSTTPSQQMAAEAPDQPKRPGSPPAGSEGPGAAWVFRDLASI
jgi:hypothetical protein